jgi:hypothetical protein
MQLEGLNITLSIGKVVPAPAPRLLTEALQNIEVTQEDEGRSGFQITFSAQRSEALSWDYPIITSGLLKPFNRVLLTASINNGPPQVITDGVITNIQLTPSGGARNGTITVTGEDVSAVMDLYEFSIGYTALGDALIAGVVLAKYALYGVIPMVIPPLSSLVRLPVESAIRQLGTDRAFLQKLAAKHGFVFFVKPGLAPGVNIAYWGPSLQGIGMPLKTLNVDLGPATNVESINFQYDPLAPNLMHGTTFDPLANAELPVLTLLSTRLPPLASEPALIFNQPFVRNSQYTERRYGLIEALASAQATTNKSTENVVTATGEVNVVRYGSMLASHGLVGLRGAGYSYDGMYYVKRVTHQISRGAYIQRFTLTREGTGSLVEVLPP